MVETAAAASPEPKQQPSSYDTDFTSPVTSRMGGGGGFKRPMAPLALLTGDATDARYFVQIFTFFAWLHFSITG